MKLGKSSWSWNVTMAMRAKDLLTHHDHKVTKVSFRWGKDFGEDELGALGPGYGENTKRFA